MGTAKWWVCGDCSSLNDLPAGKCYKCRAAKPSEPRLIDDAYAEVSATKRVSVTVDRAMVSEIVRQDPIETQPGGSVMEAFDAPEQAGGAGSSGAWPTIQPSSSDPARGAAGTMGPAERLTQSSVPPMRDPTPRGIEQIGGRPWTDGLAREPAAEEPGEEG